MQKCSKCGAENPASAKFCIKCGHKLSAIYCPVCGQPNQFKGNKCIYCNSEWDDEGNIIKERPSKHPFLDDMFMHSGSNTIALIGFAILFFVLIALVQWFVSLL